MKRGKPLGTKRAKAYTREPERRFLIYCEGEVTETIYLRGLKGDLREKPISLKLGNRHGEPLSLVKSAIDHVVRGKRCGEEPFDEVWCVLDVESPVPHPSLAPALRLAKERGIRCAVSSPCFELWLLLHFGYHGGELSSEQAASKLAKCLKGYDPKGSKSFDYDGLRGRIANARASAPDLHTRHLRGGKIGCWCVSNPCTSVDSLLDALGY